MPKAKKQEKIIPMLYLENKGYRNLKYIQVSWSVNHKT